MVQQWQIFSEDRKQNDTRFTLVLTEPGDGHLIEGGPAKCTVSCDRLDVAIENALIDRSSMD